jgi:hypothetical protein
LAAIIWWENDSKVSRDLGHLLISKYCINFPDENIKPQKPYQTLPNSIQVNISHAFPALRQVIK